MIELSPEERFDLLRFAERSLFHLELRTFYASDQKQFQAWLSGDRTPPDDWPQFVEWATVVGGHVASGCQVRRIRVFDDPPTDYQRWERWLGRWNTEAGEQLRTVPRAVANAVGLTADLDDWWLIDSEKAVIQRFDDDGVRIGLWLVTDPAEVNRLAKQWELAMANSEIEKYPQPA